VEILKEKKNNIRKRRRKEEGKEEEKRRENFILEQGSQGAPLHLAMNLQWESLAS
jgi:hypothetical protein